ncbi:MAG: hypothetical protein JXD21_04750 [Candidatus Omnitrophica bacterium]|nr:hypothetical protein [Candidatus Omnitrophota bacterium]
MHTHEFQRKSAAVTLSDMEMFIFPELLYSLLLANLMSPRIWQWRNDPWFKTGKEQSPYRRILRLRQYIMDHYLFNLDLDTWGLTTKQRERARFARFIDVDVLKESNALFGYEGDKYYFDMNIRTHFGLDKYDSEVIPYWKTETVEAMDAFRYKPGYTSGAGECVSLSVLYAAALYIVAGIPLDDIFLMATPLHSQNFVNVKGGILTNNRRIVTKTMWINGTELSMKARRALENERVTTVSHQSGYIHLIYKPATIDPGEFTRFSRALDSFLTFPLTEDVLASFLRYRKDLHKCFQIRWQSNGKDHYIGVDRVFAREEKTPYMVTDPTYAKLMAEIPQEEFIPSPLPGKIVLDDLKEYLRTHKVDFENTDDVKALKRQFASDCFRAEIAIENLVKFCAIKAQLPPFKEKEFISQQSPVKITQAMTREDIIDHLSAIRTENVTADLAFYALRDLSECEPFPFLYAALSRNPVSIEAAKPLDTETVIAKVNGFSDESVYDGPVRIAQPDEVWNFSRGDGLEKAILLANILHARMPQSPLRISLDKGKAVLTYGHKEVVFDSSKKLAVQQWDLSGCMDEACV